MAGIALVTALVLALLSAPAHAAFPGRNGKIVFDHSFYVGTYTPPDCEQESGSACSTDIYATVLRTSTLGGGRSREIRTCRRRRRCSDGDPAYAPRGRRLAFDTSGGFILGGDVFVSRSDGSRRRQVRLPSDFGAYAPTWSPDGRMLAFTVSRCIAPGFSGSSCGYVDRVYIARPDGSELRELSNTGNDSDPAWSSRGGIAFERGYRDEGQDIYVIRENGTGLRRLTFRGGEAPAWSPDGRRLAFTRGPLPERQFINVLDVRTGTLRRLTSGPGFSPAWSPDGRWIVFTRDTSSGDGIFIVRSSGGRPRMIARPRGSASSYGNPDWQPLR
jgi:Tol biopolymer transport system component